MLSKTVPAPWAGFCTRIDTNPCFVTACDVWSCGADGGGLAALWWRRPCSRMCSCWLRGAGGGAVRRALWCRDRAMDRTSVVWFLNLILRISIVVVESFLL